MEAVAENPVRDLRRALALTRERTLKLYGPLAESALEKRAASCLGPALWDLGHIAAFEELWIVHKAGGRPLENPERLRLYDPFEVPRSERQAGMLPGHAETLDYMRGVRARTLEMLERGVGGGDNRLLDGGFVYRMAVQHEWQHQEIVLQGLDLGTDEDPYPAARVGRERQSGTIGTSEIDDTARIAFEGGRVPIGSDDATATYDNERPRHQVSLGPFAIDRHPVTCRRYLEFVEDGGYCRPELWTPAGRAWLAESRARAPQGWSRGADGRWSVTRMGHRLPLDPREPVQHVCAHEADAFARWAGGRLPTEFEWEAAAGAERWPWGGQAPDPERANLFGDTWGPCAVGSFPRGDTREGVCGLLGDVYEWTASTFRGYPGFEAWPYSEYSEVFFGNEYRVLRGASWAAGPWMARSTYRNWDFPERRQIFAGLRLAWDPD